MPNSIVVPFAAPYLPEIIRIRRSVFTLEQGIDETLDLDGRDKEAVHALAFRDRPYVATGRMLRDGHIGRLAVLKSHRGHGIGRLILETLIAAARRQGLHRVFLGAQMPAAGFYIKLGFNTFGEPFRDAGIEHIHMEKTIKGEAS